MRTTAVLVLALGIGFTSHADVRAEVEVSGAEREASYQPEHGFVGRAFALDASGQRLAWLAVDPNNSKAELQIYDLQSGTLVAGGAFNAPANLDRLAFVPGGEHVMWWKTASRVEAGLNSLTGKREKRFLPGQDIALSRVGDAFCVATYRVSKPRGRVVHSVHVVALPGQSSCGNGYKLETDAKGRSSRLGFRVNHFLAGYTKVGGLKSGTWSQDTGVRTPDYFAEYELHERTFVKSLALDDLRTQYEVLAAWKEKPNRETFLYPRAADLVRVSHKFESIELAEPISHYNLSTLDDRELPDGAIAFAVDIEPMHPEAEKARRAAKRWTDIYLLKAGATRAVRKARIFSPGESGFRWQASSDKLVVLENHTRFGPGGPEISVFKFTP